MPIDLHTSDHYLVGEWKITNIRMYTSKSTRTCMNVIIVNIFAQRQEKFLVMTHFCIFMFKKI